MIRGCQWEQIPASTNHSKKWQIVKSTLKNSLIALRAQVFRLAVLGDISAGICIQDDKAHVIILQFLPRKYRLLHRETLLLPGAGQSISAITALLQQLSKQPDWLTIGIQPAGYLVKQLMLPPMRRTEIDDFLAENMSEIVPKGSGDLTYFYRYAIVSKDATGIHLLVVIARATTLSMWQPDAPITPYLTLSPLAMMTAIAASGEKNEEQWLIHTASEGFDHIHLQNGAINRIEFSINGEAMASHLPEVNEQALKDGFHFIPAPDNSRANRLQSLLATLAPQYHLAALLAVSACQEQRKFPNLLPKEQQQALENNRYRSLVIKSALTAGLSLLLLFALLTGTTLLLNRSAQNLAGQLEGVAPDLAQRDSMLAVERHFVQQLQEFRTLAEQRSHRSYLHHLLAGATPSGLWFRKIESAAANNGKIRVRVEGLSLNQRLVGELLARYEELPQTSEIRLKSMQALSDRKIRRINNRRYQKLIEFALEMNLAL